MIRKYVAVIAIDVIPHDDAHADHSYDSALCSRSAFVLALRLGRAFRAPPHISSSRVSSPLASDDAALDRGGDGIPKFISRLEL